MHTRPMTFFSDGLRLDGLLQLPEGPMPASGWPVVVFCSGFQGLKELIPGKFWDVLTAAGIACFSFDYRGFGTSDGERGRMIPMEQVEDVVNAVTRISQETEIDAGRLALVGWGFGGGVVVQAGAEDVRVKAVACLSGIGDGGRAVRDSRPYADWLALQERIARDRVQQVLTGKSESVSPWEVVPLDSRTRSDVDKEMYAKHERFGIEVTLRSAAAYYAFKPERVVDRISPRPVLFMHGQGNTLHPVDEARSLYARAREPKRLIELPGAVHLDWIEPEHPLNATATRLLTDWLHQSLPEGASTGIVDIAAG